MKKENPCGHCILPPWSRSQNANPTCSPFSLVSLPCTSQCTGSAPWTPHPYPARQCHNDDLQKQTPTCLWSGEQPALEKLVLGQIRGAAWYGSVPARPSTGGLTKGHSCRKTSRRSPASSALMLRRAGLVIISCWDCILAASSTPWGYLCLSSTHPLLAVMQK